MRRCALEDAELGHAGVRERGQRVVVAEAELVGHVRVARQRDRQAGVDGHLQQRRRRVELADRLAQPGGGDLHRDAGVEHRLDGGLVVVARVALRQRARAAPDLDQVGVGHDVVQPGARRLGERLEVALPDAVGRSPRPQTCSQSGPSRSTAASPTKCTEPTT